MCSENLSDLEKDIVKYMNIRDELQDKIRILKKDNQGLIKSEFLLKEDFEKTKKDLSIMTEAYHRVIKKMQDHLSEEEKWFCS